MGSHGATLGVTKEVKKGVILKLIASLHLVICHPHSLTFFLDEKRTKGKRRRHYSHPSRMTTELLMARFTIKKSGYG